MLVWPRQECGVWAGLRKGGLAAAVAVLGWLADGPGALAVAVEWICECPSWMCGVREGLVVTWRVTEDSHCQYA